MTDEQAQPAGEAGLFIYGIVPSDVEPTPDAEGVGDPPGAVTVVRHGDLAALVSEVGLTEPMGRPADLTAYQTLLDGTAAVAPVLPVRFGTVVTGPDAVEDLLEAHHDRFAAALDEFEDRVQYTVHGRFDEEEMISDFLAANSSAAALADQVRGRPEVQSREQRIRLGEMISQGVELRREAENRALIDALTPYAVAHAPRPPSSELDAMNVAFLVATDYEEDFVRAVEDFAEQRRDLIRMRLLGPLAPYDFVSAHQLAG
ncbi:GvpL/GvpF family gas vesicle protein [Micromonospora sp. RTP1Z1]|uniref:GvpL/GvpF family gas vesicle protein n=1 Tax=Micromonospora sp. RTP1Z1 TaxID=2994043 RepID=UPI0029C72268|nr:GvpL/GvpF family gas vesicle protein [Micromonospora sp. RTP1Z1]